MIPLNCRGFNLLRINKTKHIYSLSFKVKHNMMSGGHSTHVLCYFLYYSDIYCKILVKSKVVVF